MSECTRFHRSALDPKVRADAKRAKPVHRADRGVDVALRVVFPAEVEAVEIEVVLEEQLAALLFCARLASARTFGSKAER